MPTSCCVNNKLFNRQPKQSNLIYYVLIKNLKPRREKVSAWNCFLLSLSLLAYKKFKVSTICIMNLPNVSRYLELKLHCPIEQKLKCAATKMLSCTILLPTNSSHPRPCWPHEPNVFNRFKWHYHAFVPATQRMWVALLCHLCQQPIDASGISSSSSV